MGRTLECAEVMTLGWHTLQIVSSFPSNFGKSRKLILFKEVQYREFDFTQPLTIISELIILQDINLISSWFV